MRLFSGLAALAVLPLALADEQGDASLLWGTYRPGLYWGFKPRIPNGPLFGMMWFGLTDYTGPEQGLRHDVDARDGLSKATFVEHDGRSAGKQVLRDVKNNVELTTEFLKVPGAAGGRESWALRVSGKPIEEGSHSRLSVVQYVAKDSVEGSLELQNEENDEGFEEPVTIKGTLPSLGSFTVRLVAGDKNSPLRFAGRHLKDFGSKLYRTQFLGRSIPSGDGWKAKELVKNAILLAAGPLLERYGRDSPPDPGLLFSLPNDVHYNSNFLAFQRTFEGTWTWDLFFEPESDAGKAANAPLNALQLEQGLSAASRAYSDRFDRTFGLRGKHFSNEEIAFAEAITSNLVGGIGYFYGSGIVDKTQPREWDEDEDDEDREPPRPEEVPPTQLFTATPSRSFFPRGFYWDEGFHLLLIGVWDNDLAVDILKHWVDLIDEDGWVGREQILGAEARSRVPAEFVAQYPAYANPPTLALAVKAFVDRLVKAGEDFDALDPATQAVFSDDTQTSPEALATRQLRNSELAHTFLRSVYPALKRHYEWFRETQRGNIRLHSIRPPSRTEVYRWRGRSKTQILTSGLDDYPRVQPPHEGELHVDLISWMGSFAGTMRDIAQFMGETDDAADFDAQSKAIIANLDPIHWSQDDQMYCDVSVDDDGETFHDCHPGYVSLFPFLLGLLPPDSPNLGAILDLIQDPEHLWTDYGIRSLSKSDEFFGTGEDYWCGPIWIHFQYMALSVLHKKYSKEPGPLQTRAAELYDTLRGNVISTVFSEYERTGYVWEQYNSSTGKGQRSQAFTGWTSLVALMMSEIY